MWLRSPCGNVSHVDSDESLDETLYAKNQSNQKSGIKSEDNFKDSKKLDDVRGDETHVIIRRSDASKAAINSISRNIRKRSTTERTLQEPKMESNEPSFEHLFHQKTEQPSPKPLESALLRSVSSISCINSSTTFYEECIDSEQIVGEERHIASVDYVELTFRRQKEGFNPETISTPIKEKQLESSKADHAAQDTNPSIVADKQSLMNIFLVETKASLPLVSSKVSETVIDPINRTATIIREPSVTETSVNKSDSFLNDMPLKYRTSIPPVIRHCVKYLCTPENIVAFHLFVKSVPIERITKMKQEADYKEKLDFNNPYEAAVLLKIYLRELKDPLFPSAFYPAIIKFCQFDVFQRHRRAHEIMTHLPYGNLKILKYLIKFMAKVLAHSQKNKMTSDILARTLVRAGIVRDEEGCIPVNDTICLNIFMQYIIENDDIVFTDINKTIL